MLEGGLTLPNTQMFVGLTLRNQVVQFELDAGGGFTRVAGSNGIRVTIGAF